jgi:hypothetical protein
MGGTSTGAESAFLVEAVLQATMSTPMVSERISVILTSLFGIRELVGITSWK